MAMLSSAETPYSSVFSTGYLLVPTRDYGKSLLAQFTHARDSANMAASKAEAEEREGGRIEDSQVAQSSRENLVRTVFQRSLEPAAFW